MHIIPTHTRLSYLQGIVVTGFHDAIYLQLPLTELPVNREGAGMVGAVALAVLSTRITQSQSTVFQQVVRRIAVHDLTMLGEDGGEALMLAQGVSHTIYLTADIFLRQSGLGKAHGMGMHLITDGASLLNLRNLDVRFALSHLHNGLDQLHRSRLFLLVGMNAKQIHDLDHVVVTIGRKEMNLAVLLLGLVADYLQLFHGSRTVDTHLSSQIAHAVNTSIPYDVLDIDIITDKHLLILVDVDDTYQSVSPLSEIVQERGILTEGVIPVVGIVAWRLVVAEKNDDTAFQ